MKISNHCAFSLAVLLLIPLSLPAQGGAIDWSACRGMQAILRAMRDGAPKEQVSGLLDGLLETEPYKVLFQHYNRPWRPNHLPRDVFKRMILSLQFEKEYASGENERADSMRIQWKKYYPDLALYERQHRELSSQDLPRLLDDGVRYAQSWLPPEWKIPPIRVFIIPNGGSPAFSIDDVNGYDFLQLAQERPGEISLNWLLGSDR